MSASEVEVTNVTECAKCGVEIVMPCSYPQNQDQTPWCEVYTDSTEEYCKRCAIDLADEEEDNVDYEIKSRKEAGI